MVLDLLHQVDEHAQDVADVVLDGTERDEVRVGTGQQVVDGDAEQVLGRQAEGVGGVEARAGGIGLDAPVVVAEFGRWRFGQRIGPGAEVAFAAGDGGLDGVGGPEVQEREAGGRLARSALAGVVEDPVGGEGEGANVVVGVQPPAECEPAVEQDEAGRVVGWTLHSRERPVAMGLGRLGQADSGGFCRMAVPRRWEPQWRGSLAFRGRRLADGRSVQDRHERRPAERGRA